MTIYEILTYTTELYQRLSHVAKSYVLMTFYYEKGIPDEVSHEISQENGATRWYPEFKKEHWGIKGGLTFVQIVSITNSFHRGML